MSSEVVEVSFPKEFDIRCIGGTIVNESTTEDSRVLSVKIRGSFKKDVPRHVYFTLLKPDAFLDSSSTTIYTKPSLICLTDNTRLTSQVEKVVSLESLQLVVANDAHEQVDLVLPLLFSFVTALSTKRVDMISRVINFMNDIRSQPGIEAREDYQYLLAIMHDAKEAKKACEPQHWEKWGKHYLFALFSAYECEESLSSRDLGTISLFVNKSDEMKNAVADMEKKFKSLAIQSSNNISQNVVARYADAGSTVCFTPLTPVKMADGTFVPIGRLCAGMEVMTQPIQARRSQSSISSAKVISVVETKLTGHQEVVSIGEDVWATPYHPVKTTMDNGPNGWVFPKDLQEPQGIVRPTFTSVFNLILDKDHVIFVGDGCIQTVTLGHGYEYGVLKHKFFGTMDCIESLYKVAALGKNKAASPPPYIAIQQGCLIREINPYDLDGKIVAISQEYQASL
jgi:hypothetical protein